MTITDISPVHKPIALIREAERVIQEDGDITAAFVLMIREDDSVWFDGAADKRKDLLWAMERLKFELMQTAAKK